MMSATSSTASVQFGITREEELCMLIGRLLFLFSHCHDFVLHEEIENETWMEERWEATS
jgi:hypothetical protein